MSTKKTRVGRSTERFEVLPVAAARRQGSETKRAARRVAEALGSVAGDSDTVDDAGREIAFAFDIRPHNGEGGVALIVAGAAQLDGQVVLRVPEERALSGMRLGKAIASLAPERLVADARVDVEAGGVTSTVRLTAAQTLAERLGSPRILIANVEASARPAPDPDRRAELEQLLTRLQRLRELDAPAIIINNDKKLIRRAHADLVASGWDPGSEPLPEPLRSLCAQVVKPRRSR